MNTGAKYRNEQIGVPRRFSVIALLIFTTLYAITVRILLWLEAPGWLVVSVGIFLTSVGVAQACLFDGKKPRQASMLAGFFVVPILCVLVQFFVTGESLPLRIPVEAAIQRVGWVRGLTLIVFPTLVLGQFVGIACGYAVGIFAAGPFFAVQSFGQRRRGTGDESGTATETSEWDGRLSQRLGTVAMLPFNPGRPNLEAVGAAMWLSYALLPIPVAMTIMGAPRNWLNGTLGVGILLIATFAITWSGVRVAGVRRTLSISSISGLVGLGSGWFGTRLLFPSWVNSFMPWLGVVNSSWQLQTVKLLNIALLIAVVSIIGVGLATWIDIARTRGELLVTRSRWNVGLVAVLCLFHLGLGIGFFGLARQPRYAAANEIAKNGGSVIAYDEMQVFGGERFSDKEARLISLLNQLEKCYLANADITDEGLAVIRSPRLTELFLSNTRITGSGFKDVSAPMLKRLVLTNTNVTDESLSHLGKFNALTHLDLVGCDITDAGVEHIKKFTSLTTLVIRHTKITSARVEQLKNCLPLCEISHEGI